MYILKKIIYNAKSKTLFLTKKAKKAIKQIKKEKNMHYINIKGKQIQTIIREYTTSNNLKIYFKGNILNISKPKRMTFKKLQKVIKENENEIYNQYNKIMSNENNYIKHWKTGEKILYKGEEYKIRLKEIETDRINIQIKLDEKIFEIKIPKGIDDEDKKKNVDRAIKKLFKINTEALIYNKLPYWSKKTKIEYTQFKIGDATSKFRKLYPK